MLQLPYPIHTARLILRSFQATDLDDLYAFHALPEVTRFLYWEARTREETAQVLARKATESQLTQEGDRLSLAVVLPAHTQDSPRDTVIGEVILMWQSQQHQQGEIGFVFHPAYHGRGYATEAARVVLALGFDQLGLHRIYGRCDARNTGSYQLMARLGMRREAHFVHNEIFKGEWGDEFVYALRHDEWAAQTASSPRQHQQGKGPDDH